VTVLAPVFPEPPEPSSANAFGASELAVLADLSQAFAQSIDLNQTLREAVTRIAQHMRAEAASLFLLDPETGDCVCRASAGPVDVVGLRIYHGHGIVGRTLAENRVQLVRDVQHDPDYIGSGVRVKGFTPRTMVCTPLTGAAGPIGALQVINKANGELFGTQDADMLRLLAVPTTLALNNARLAVELLEQNRIRREFELARQMQKTLFPKRRAAFPVNAINKPAREISGDFYDFFELADGRIGFAIGDVSGKGMDAAMLMVRASALLRFFGKTGLAPSAWLASANEELAETVRFGMFVCALVGYYEPDSGMVELASAGFPPALLHLDGADEMREIEAHGPPLGVLAPMQFGSERICVAGANLYAFSDGMTDIRDAHNQVIGVGGVKDLIQRVSLLSPAARLRGMLHQLRNQHLPDDTTILLVAENPQPPRLLSEIGCLSDAQNLRALRQVMRATLTRLGVAEELFEQIVLAVDEALANVIRHGYGGRDDGRLELSNWLIARELHCVLRDYAAPVDPACVRPRDLDECRAGGLGINLIDMTFDRWGFSAPEHGPGNVLRMVKVLP
jgi:phosphoserine phosphatase RsbU/P